MMLCELMSWSLGWSTSLSGGVHQSVTTGIFDPSRLEVKDHQEHDTAVYKNKVTIDVKCMQSVRREHILL